MCVCVCVCECVCLCLCLCCCGPGHSLSQFVTVRQFRELEAAYERERGGQQELLAKHEAVCRWCSVAAQRAANPHTRAVCSEAMEAEAALKAVREAASAADKQRHSTKAELDETKERCFLAFLRRAAVRFCNIAAGTG